MEILRRSFITVSSLVSVWRPKVELCHGPCCTFEVDHIQSAHGKWEVTRPLPNLTTLRVNAEIPKPVAPYRPAAGVKVEAEGKAMAAKRSFVVKGAGPSPDVQDTAENARIKWPSGSRSW